MKTSDFRCTYLIRYNNFQVNDYEEDNAEYGSESIGKISAHLKARDIGLEDISKNTDDGAPPVPSNFTKITPLVCNLKIIIIVSQWARKF